MTTLSVVIPIKDERDNLRPLHERAAPARSTRCGRRVGRALSDYEILLVDDGSADGSFAVLEELAAARPPRQGRRACAATSARRRPCRPASTGPPAT